MSYQKCPICNGAGIEPSVGIYTRPCSVWAGAKIIHTVTGQPPTRIEQVIDPQVKVQLQERLIEQTRNRKQR